MMTAEEAIFKMLVQVLQNQRVALRAAQSEAIPQEWKDTFTRYVSETDELLMKVQQK